MVYLGVELGGFLASSTDAHASRRLPLLLHASYGRRGRTAFTRALRLVSSPLLSRARGLWGHAVLVAGGSRGGDLSTITIGLLGPQVMVFSRACLAFI